VLRVTSFCFFVLVLWTTDGAISAGKENRKNDDTLS